MQFAHTEAPQLLQIISARNEIVPSRNLVPELHAEVAEDAFEKTESVALRDSENSCPVTHVLLDISLPREKTLKYSLIIR